MERATATSNTVCMIRLVSRMVLNRAQKAWAIVVAEFGVVRCINNSALASQVLACAVVSTKWSKAHWTEDLYMSNMSDAWLLGARCVHKLYTNVRIK